MKRFLVFFGIATLLIALPLYLWADEVQTSMTVVIDPGHGGQDPGSLGRISAEKDIVLAISLKLGEYIREHMPDVKIVFTREGDYAVSVHERARIANNKSADLFISIHTNGVDNHIVQGTETFVMGMHTSQANLEVARRENKAILYEDDYEEAYDGFDPNSVEATIILGLYQHAYLEQSLQMASLVQQQFRERTHRIDRGVKQAGFWVLYQVSMPSVLIETGFITNPEEERFLISKDGQVYIASAIFRAFREYKEERDEAKARIAQRSSPNNQQARQNSEPEILFRIQFATSTEEKEAGDPLFQDLNRVFSYYHEGLYKHTAGSFSSIGEAAKMQQQMRDAGFNDAFIVAFLGDQRITTAEALKMINDQKQD